MDYLKTLFSSARALLVAYVAGGAMSAEAQSDRETQLWNECLAVGTVEACQRYLDEFPVGRYASDAFRTIVEISIDASRGGSASGSAAGLGGAGIVAELY